MKLFLIGTLLFSGGTAVAVQNEEVRDRAVALYQNVRERVQHKMKENLLETVKENGFPYPSEERLENLTEDQQFELITLIDQFNATYDWANMTDEEIMDALAVCEDEIHALAEELGIELPQDPIRNTFRNRVNRRTREVVKDRLITNLQENGLEYPHQEFLDNLTEEQQQAIVDKIDEFNATYDWANMTEEEIMDAMLVIRAELRELNEEFGIIPPRGPQPEENPTEEGTEEGLDIV
jgi:uncharacterized membrane-anchored protein YjiN (DUF445 family)